MKIASIGKCTEVRECSCPHLEARPEELERREHAPLLGIAPLVIGMRSVSERAKARLDHLLSKWDAALLGAVPRFPWPLAGSASRARAESPSAAPWSSVALSMHQTR